MIKIGFPHHPGGGGPGSFQKRFEEQLILNGYKIIYASSKEYPDLVFIVGGTRKILWLLKCKIKGIPIIYRLDGILWLHKKTKFHLKTFIISEVQNLLAKFIHAVIANHIIYQSNFVRNWWAKVGWNKNVHFSIIYNAVDLNSFFPLRSFSNMDIVPRLICLEGYLFYSPYAIDLINALSSRINLDFFLYGGIKSDSEILKLEPNVHYMGKVKMSDLPSIYQNSIYLSLDVNAACPNTVIEALACGAPVVGFDTGALGEIVQDEGGKIASFGSNPWKLAFPNIDALIESIEVVSNDFKNYSMKARKLAENNYSINTMVDKYIHVFNLLLSNKDY